MPPQPLAGPAGAVALQVRAGLHVHRADMSSPRKGVQGEKGAALLPFGNAAGLPLCGATLGLRTDSIMP